MFCPKCGAKVLEGAEFCSKCGAELVVDNAKQNQPKAVGQQQGGTQAKPPKKKKSKKLLIILAIVFVLIVILIIANADDWAESGKEYERQEEYIKSQQGSTDVNLSETYTNEEEGISFQYPSAWVPVGEDEFVSRFGKMEDEEYPIVLLANEIEDLPEENTYIMVSRFDATQDMIDHLFIDDEQFASTFDSDAKVLDTSTTEIDSVAARKITYLDKDEIGYQSYFYAVGSVLYRIDFSYQGESAGNTQRFFDAVIGSYQITTAEIATGKNDSADASQPADADKLLYNGIPVDTIMEMQAEDVTAAFGTPDEYSDENFVQILSEDGEHLVAMANFDSAGYVSYFAGDPEKFELNGQDLNHDYDKLVKIFGREPDSEVTFDLLEVKWFYDDYSVLLGLDNDGLPGKIDIRKKYTQEQAQQLIYDWIESTHQLGIIAPEYVDEGIIAHPSGSNMEAYIFHLVEGDNIWVTASVEKDTGEIWAIPDAGDIMPLHDYYNAYYGVGDNGDAVAGNLPDGFIWVEEPVGKTDEWSTMITGIIQNISEQDYSLVDISFNLYDSSGNQVGTAYAHINNLKAGGTWKFQAVDFVNAPRFEFSEVDYY